MTNQLPASSTGRRAALERVPFEPRSTNPGLWFDRYYRITSGREVAENKRELLDHVAQLGIPSVYPTYYDAWRAALPEECVLAIAEVTGRMVIGTGDKGVAEAGITLHHTYGVPYLPGSALKGLAAAYASLRVEGFSQSTAPTDQPRPSNYEIMFGAEGSAGYLTFFDALYIPTLARNDQPLALDVITGHHSAYYVGDEPESPADWDSPVPVPFLTATGKYLIAIAGDAQWATTARTIIGMALRDSGIGAKTAAGYGRMRLLSMDGEPIKLPDVSGVTRADTTGTSSSAAAPPDPETAAADAVIAQVASLPLQRVPTEINKFYQQWKALRIGAVQRQRVAEAIVSKVRQAGRETASAEKAWYKELCASLSALDCDS